MASVCSPAIDGLHGAPHAAVSAAEREVDDTEGEGVSTWGSVQVAKQRKTDENSMQIRFNEMSFWGVRQSPHMWPCDSLSPQPVPPGRTPGVLTPHVVGIPKSDSHHREDMAFVPATSTRQSEALLTAALHSGTPHHY